MPLGPFSFEAPVWLWLAAIGVPVALLAVRLLASMTGLRRWTAAVARAALFALIAVTLAGAASVRETDRLAVVAVVDVSGSVLRYGPQVVDEQGRREAIVDRVRGWLARSTRGRGPDDLLGIVVFDGQALAVAAPTAGDPLDRPFEAAGAEGSDLGAALRLARALIPADAAGRIVLISDGNQTAGDAIGAAREASSPRGQRGPTPIDVAPIEYRLTREVFVESVDAPASAGAEATITLRVALVATSPSRGVLRVLQDGQSVDATPERDGDALPIELAAGRTVVAVPVALSPARTHRFEVIFEPAREDSGEGAVPGGEVRLVGDTDVANNRGEAFTVTPGRGSILILDGDGQGNPGGPGATLANVWREAGIEAELAAPDAMPGDLLSLQRYDMVVLQNVPADALGPERMELLSAYVRDLGGGLLTLGGRESYGAGGWKGSALEELLPVSLDLPERLLSPDLAVVFVMDRSGSMGWRVQGSTRSKQEITSEAAAAAVRSLQATDLVGVVTYNLDHQVVVPLGPNTDPERTATSILGISPDGGTASGSALREAERQLLAVDAKTRHIILLSDGQSMDADILPDMARQMHERGITISTIAVGDGAHIESMRLVAFYGGGTFYEVVNPSVLPRVFLRAVRVLRTPMVRESAFRPLLGVGESPLVAGVSGVDEDGLPRLMGLNLTQARAETTAINALVTPDGEPVLAHWQVELGQVVSFTSDVWRWGAAWPEWGAFGRCGRRLALASRPAAARAGPGRDDPGRAACTSASTRPMPGRPLDLLTIGRRCLHPTARRAMRRSSRSGRACTRRTWRRSAAVRTWWWPSRARASGRSRRSWRGRSRPMRRSIGGCRRTSR
ncbi:MAG: VWA domain-containing protein [Phycisphaerales bacterium]